MTNGAHILAVAIVGVIVAGFVLHLNPARIVNRMIAVVSAVVASWAFSIFMAVRIGAASATEPDVSLLFWIRLSSASAAFIVWASYLLRAAISTGSTTTWRIVRGSWLWFLASACLAVLAFSESYVPSHSTPAHPLRGYGHQLYTVCVLILAGLQFAESTKLMRQLKGIRRLEVQYFVISIGFATVLAMCSYYLSRHVALNVFSRLGPVLVLLAFFASAWAVTHHRVFDAREAAALFAHRLLTLLVLGLVTIVLERLLAKPVGGPAALTLAILTAGTVTLLADAKVRKWLHVDEESNLHRARQALLGLARTTADPAALQDHFEAFLCQECQTSRAYLLTRTGHAYERQAITIEQDWVGLTVMRDTGWITPESLQRRRQESGTPACLDFFVRHQLGLLVGAPPGGSAPMLLVALGAKFSERPYTYPGIRRLLNIVQLMDNLLAHARLVQQSAQLRRMESAAMMSRNLAHDLNNLAMPVATFLSHTESKVRAGTPEAEVFGDAKRSLTVMQDYIRESLFFARKLAPRHEAADLRRIIGDSMRLCQGRAARRRVDLRTEAGPPCPVTADPVLLQRLLVNLLDNAIDASPAGAPVVVAVAPATRDAIRLSVADRGHGVPPEILPHIFEPYFTTKDGGEDVRGFGLGLAICRKIAMLHGSDIDVTRTEGGGATFSIVLRQSGSAPARSTAGS